MSIFKSSMKLPLVLKSILKINVRLDTWVIASQRFMGAFNFRYMNNPIDFFKTAYTCKMKHSFKSFLNYMFIL